MRRIVAGIAFALALAGCRGGIDNAAEPAAEQAAAAAMPLTVTAADGTTHRFQVEVARTAEEQAQGLMFRTSLANDAGMLFPFAEPRVASFWMENTAIPLDMIFVRGDGTIARIADNTVPYSREPVSSLEPVIATLELAGGRAGELGIAEGDRVSWPGGPGLNAAPQAR